METKPDLTKPRQTTKPKTRRAAKPSPPTPEAKPVPPATPQQRITKEMRRLKSRLRGMDKNKLDTAEPLIRNAARLTVALDDIWEDYNRVGYVEKYDNGGGQKGSKPSEARKAINEMTKHHIAIMRQLIELAPPKPPKRDELDDILDFLS